MQTLNSAARRSPTDFSINAIIGSFDHATLKDCWLGQTALEAAVTTQPPPTTSITTMSTTHYEPSIFESDLGTASSLITPNYLHNQHMFSINNQQTVPLPQNQQNHLVQQFANSLAVQQSKSNQQSQIMFQNQKTQYCNSLFAETLFKTLLPSNVHSMHAPNYFLSPSEIFAKLTTEENQIIANNIFMSTNKNQSSTNIKQTNKQTFEKHKSQRKNKLDIELNEDDIEVDVVGYDINDEKLKSTSSSHQTFNNFSTNADITRIHDANQLIYASKSFNKLQSTTSLTRPRQRPKKHICPICNLGLSNKGQLISHIRSHTGERPFACDHSFCNKAFTRNEELTRHKRIHSGHKPFPCQICSKRFGRKDHLKKHIKTHTKRLGSR